MSLLRRSPKPADDAPPDGLEMTIKDIFWITPMPKGKRPRTGMQTVMAKRPGTVLMGELVGDGALRVGDTVIAGGGRFPILNFVLTQREQSDRVVPPCNVGLRLGVDVARELFTEGEQVRFARDAS